jgi:hypothetical protein
MPQPAPGIRTWDDGEFIRRMLAWFARQIEETHVSPSACQILGHKLSELAQARMRGWSPDA